MPQLWTDIKTHAIPWKAVDKFCRQWIITSFICMITLGFLSSILRPLGLLLALWICSRQIDPLLDKSIGRKRFIASYLLAWWVSYTVSDYLPVETWDTNLRLAILASVSGITLTASHIVLQGDQIRQDTGRRILLVIGYIGSSYLSRHATHAFAFTSPIHPWVSIFFLLFSESIEYLITGLPVALIQKELPQTQPVQLLLTAPDQPRRFRIFLPYPWRQIIFYPLLLICTLYLRVPLLNFELDLFNPPYRPAPVEKGIPLPTQFEPIKVQNARKVTPLALWDDYNDDKSGGPNSVFNLKFSADNRSLWASTGIDRQIRIWSLESGTPARTLPAYWFDLSNDNQHLAIYQKETLSFYHTADWSEYFSKTQSVYILQFDPEGTLLVTGGYSEPLILWRVADGSEITRLPEADSIAFSNDGTMLASGDSEGIVRIWNTADLHLIHTVDTPPDPQNNHYTITALAFNPKNTVIAYGNMNGKIYLRSIETGQLTRTLHSKYAIVGIKFIADGTILATLSESEDLKLWDASTGELLMQYNNENMRFHTFAISSDETLIALGSRTSSAIVILGIPKRN